jgi:hypothetical protein
MPFSKGPTYAIATSDNEPHNKFPNQPMEFATVFLSTQILVIFVVYNYNKLASLLLLLFLALYM